MLMAKDKDYRNTMYCIALEDVGRKKQALEEEIKSEFPHTKILYNKVHDRKNVYHDKFAEIYNGKCGYCGVLWGLLPTESFEVDHFINEASFPKTTEGKAKAGRLKNLVWSCISCNRGKHGLTIIPPYDNILNVDNGNIANVFSRDENLYIQICDTYKDDDFIKQFYKGLHLGYEARRLDYLGLRLQGMYQNQEDEEKKSQLGEMLSLLIKKRNRMKTTSER